MYMSSEKHFKMVKPNATLKHHYYYYHNTEYILHTKHHDPQKMWQFMFCLSNSMHSTRPNIKSLWLVQCPASVDKIMTWFMDWYSPYLEHSFSTSCRKKDFLSSSFDRQQCTHMHAGFSIAGVWAPKRPKISAQTPKFQDVDVMTSKSNGLLLCLGLFVYKKLLIDVRIFKCFFSPKLVQ